MDYPKVPQEINNIVGDNVKLLAQLFPSAVKDGQVDFEALKEELGQFEEVGKEKYELTWAGKQDAKKKAQEDVYNRTLKYIEADSKNPETTENLYIEGDNLEVLKLLRQNYYGAIKMIYIDPPYNTGNDFVYNDNFAMGGKESDIAEGVRDDEGNPLQKNQQSSNRYHANWLNMMYPRLKVAKDLLTDDGVVFISIDDNEFENLKKICDDVFGTSNCLGTFVINSTPNARDYGHIGKMHEFALFYGKNVECTITNMLPELDKKFKYCDADGGFNIHPLYNSNEAFTNANRPNLFYPFYLYLDEKIEGDFFKIGLEKKENCVSIYPPKSVKNSVQFVWRWGKEKSLKYMNKDIIGYKTNDGEYRVVQKMRHSEKLIRSLLTDTKFSSRRGTAEVEEIFNGKFFSFPKPLGLLKDFISVGLEKDDFILDFFSGSATTAHAVMQLNAEDGGNRKYIMVQLPEETDEKSEAFKAGYKNICELGKERIRRAGEKIKEEIETANAQLKLGEEPKQVPDIGFKVFRTADTNIKWNIYNELGQIDTATMAHTPDLADFTYGFNDIDVVYEVMLRQKDVPLSSTLETLTDIGSRTYLYGSAYLVCLETEITETLIDKLAALDPLPIKFIFRDSAFKDDINLKDETFRRLKNLIERNSGLTKKTYTVEFI